MALAAIVWPVFFILLSFLRSRYHIIQEVPLRQRNITLDRLLPATEYQLVLSTVTEAGDNHTSRLVHFISPSDNESHRFRLSNLNRPIHTDPEKKSNEFSVREDEVVIVVLVLAGWIGCLLLFFNKWGKIRMLEPYQPAYHSSEAYHSSVHSIHPKTSRMNTCASTNVPSHMQSAESRASLIAPERDFVQHHPHCSGVSAPGLYHCVSATTYPHSQYRARLNSVFVGSPYHRNSLTPEPSPGMPRKVKSAEDLKSLVVQITHHDHQAPSTSTADI